MALEGPATEECETSTDVTSILEDLWELVEGGNGANARGDDTTALGVEEIEMVVGCDASSVRGSAIGKTCARRKLTNGVRYELKEFSGCIVMIDLQPEVKLRVSRTLRAIGNKIFQVIEASIVETFGSRV